MMNVDLTAVIEISARADEVWTTLADLESYSAWNPFIVAAEGTLTPGQRLNLRMQPVGGRAVDLRPVVVEVTPGRRLRWRGRLWFPGLLDAEHEFTLEPTAAGTRLTQHEHFRGILAPFLARMLRTSTMPAFHAMNEALKRRVEQRVQHQMTVA